MALGNKKKDAGKGKAKADIKTKPEFKEDGTETTAGAGTEADPGTEAEETPAEEVEAEVVEDAPAEETPAEETPAETKDVAVKAEAGAITSPGAITMAYTEIQDAMPIIEFGILPRFHGSNGQLLDGDNKSIGDEIKLELLSWRYTYQITPGSNDDDAKEFVKYSDDGRTINDTQQPIADYIAEIKGQWPKTSMKKYVELTGMLIESNGKAAEEFLMETIQISLSPQSRKAFENHRMQMMVKLRMKKIEAIPSQIVILAEPASWGSNDYTKLITKA